MLLKMVAHKQTRLRTVVLATVAVLVLAACTGIQPVVAPPPEAAVTVDMVDFAYLMPDTVPAGKQIWEFTNSGEQWHLAAIATYNPDASSEEILAAFGGENQPPLADAMVQIRGGLPPMSAGGRVWLEVDLAPGAYELLCPLPDVTALATGDEPLPHLLHGMRHAFTGAN